MKNITKITNEILKPFFAPTKQDIYERNKEEIDAIKKQLNKIKNKQRFTLRYNDNGIIYDITCKVYGKTIVISDGEKERYIGIKNENDLALAIYNFAKYRGNA